MLQLVKMDIGVKIEHSALRWADEECYYLFGFYPGRRFGFDAGNDLVKNFKRPIDRSDGRALRQKTRAIRDLANILAPMFAAMFDPVTTTFVPVPPSLTRDSPYYDDRVVRLLRLASPVSADVRELVVCREEREPTHFNTERPSVEALLGNYMLGEEAAKPVRERIVVFDDVVTSGNHFMACKRFLLGHFPGRQVVGVFIARRVLG